MKSIKLYSLLKILSKEEIKAAGKFLRSPYHNTDKQVQKMFARIAGFHPAMQSPQLENEALFNYLFPDEEEYDERKMRNLRYKLTQALESFMIVHSLQYDPTAGRHQLIEIFLEKKAYDLARKEIVSQLKRLSDRPGKGGIEYHKEMAWLNRQLYFLPDTDWFQLNHPVLFEAIEQEEVAFSLSMLCFGAELMTRKKVLKDKRSSLFFEMVRQLGGEHFAPKNRIVKLYIELLGLAQKEDDLPGFIFLKKSLYGHFEKKNIGLFELGVAWNILANYAIAHSNGDCAGKWTNELLELYKEGLANQWILNGQAIDATKFINISITGAMALDFLWTEKFINKYQSLLEKKGKENILQLCWAYFYYYRGKKGGGQKDFNKALSIIQTLTREGTAFDLRLRSLELRIYYDSAEGNPFDEQIMSDRAKYFKGYLTRHSEKISEEKEIIYLNFVDIYEELISLKFSNKKINKNKLKNKIKGHDKLAFKCWLLEKIAEMGN